jgi:hypothetical protein
MLKNIIELCHIYLKNQRTSGKKQKNLVALKRERIKPISVTNLSYVAW